MSETEKAIENLNTAKLILCNPQTLTPEMCIKIGQVITSSIVLLKEQEAVEPTLIREGRNKYYNDYVCPHCDNEVIYEQNYCSECGAQFRWEGR